MPSREQQLASLPAGAQAPPPKSLLGRLLQRLIGPFQRGQSPAPQPATGFYTDTTVCIGCKACEVACKQWNQLPADGFAFTGNSYDNTGELSATSWRHVKFIEQLEAARPAASTPTPRISLDVLQPEAAASYLPPELNRWLMMSDVCKHCVAAPCYQACPTGAILVNEFANIYIQQDICNGCAYCIAACPFGVITRASFDGHAHKCTLCYDRQKDGLVPACAKACPTASIQFGPVDELRERAARRVQELHARGVPEAYLYGDQATETYTPLHSFYLLVDTPRTYGLPDEPFHPWLHMKGDYLKAVISGLLSLAVLGLCVWLGGGRG
jgi:formate dehydrogenase iron-sulfur subunit